MMKIRKDIGQKSLGENKGYSDSKIDDYRYILDSVNSWIISADNKVGIYCGMYSVIIAAITLVASHLLSGLSNSICEVNPYVYTCFEVTALLTGASFVVSIVFYTLSITPNLIGKKSKGNEPRKELSLFYADIAQFKSPENFKNVVKKVDREKYYDELLSEVYYNSDVCTKKMKRFQWAVAFSTLSVVFSIIACAAYYFAFR